MDLTERVVDGRTVVLTVHGMVDMASAPALADHVREVLRRRTRVTVVDLSSVTFLATAGISVLAAAQHRCDQLGVELRIVADGPITARPMQLLGLDRVFRLYPSAAAALAATNATDSRNP